MEKRHLLEVEQQQEALAAFNALDRIKAIVDWDRFTPILAEAFGPPRTSGRGRRSWDHRVLFRCLLLGIMHGLSDARLHFLLLDRTTFKPFAGLRSLDQVPDQKTLWKSRDLLAKAGCIEELVAVFKEQLAGHGYELPTGTLVASSLVQCHRQHNTRAENALVKEGDVPADWEENPATLRPKDVDARWVKKNGVRYFGSKNPLAVDRATKFITNWAVTSANVHDSQVFEVLLDTHPPNGHEVYADSAYRPEEGIKSLVTKKFKPRIIHKAKRGTPLSPRQKILNHRYSKVRCRVEHVFGSIRNDMSNRSLLCLGQGRARVRIGLTNLCSNIRRFSYRKRVEEMALV